MSEKKSKMSSNVLNMKFMKQAEIREEERQREDKESRLKDLSEWRTASSESLKKRLVSKNRQNPRMVGYQTVYEISNVGSPVVGRRTFNTGERKTKTKNLEDAAGGEGHNEQGDEDMVELDTLWKKDTSKTRSKSKRPLSDESPKKETKKRRSHP
ncbi:Mpp6p CYBJADRAFT_174355 [Cyberlindnera jadinii NRRL Y-1542]|uniref:M-phase phosphoprotein 6 n=1 Tax=Cyberlindnera jadinii (strain ATCC 18201 / CBS 1600 / BCRC 20928 / JCM 3617 / NBRC 0987 / NRRL Y-1542) TaxID=983966 RepID=A0A1E4RXU7_CYBJN|nr:hypothetical protein CYBJADRAFT_174355 [Cyberlindnera jadinii NRRL Y-1542]ODV72088.1 hypothetical protein CYBJADRAFT_174355 [Cyberlindnera jadinii NRRL Y-1542]